jgi:PleD family two-component response regulator
MSKPAQPQQILLVDDDAGAIQLLGGLLASVAALRFATNGKDALRLAHEVVPDLILLDAEMPGMSGFQLLQALKADAELTDVPVIFITSHTEAGFEVSALEMGAVDFIAKPFRSSLVLARVRLHLRMKHMADGLRRAATVDSLTGVANRRMLDQSLAREWLLSRRSGDPISLLSIDVDHSSASLFMTTKARKKTTRPASPPRTWWWRRTTPWGPPNAPGAPGQNCAISPTPTGRNGPRIRVPLQ